MCTPRGRYDTRAVNQTELHSCQLRIRIWSYSGLYTGSPQLDSWRCLEKESVIARSIFFQHCKALFFQNGQHQTARGCWLSWLKGEKAEQVQRRGESRSNVIWKKILVVGMNKYMKEDRDMVLKFLLTVEGVGVLRTCGTENDTK